MPRPAPVPVRNGRSDQDAEQRMIQVVQFVQAHAALLIQPEQAGRQHLILAGWRRQLAVTGRTVEDQVGFGVQVTLQVYPHRAVYLRRRKGIRRRRRAAGGDAQRHRLVAVETRLDPAGVQQRPVAGRALQIVPNRAQLQCLRGQALHRADTAFDAGQAGARGTQGGQVIGVADVRPRFVAPYLLLQSRIAEAREHDNFDPVPGQVSGERQR